MLKLALAIALFLGSTPALAATTNCDAQLAATADYSQAISELARGYIQLEQTKMSGGASATTKSLTKLLQEKYNELLTQLEKSVLDKALADALKKHGALTKKQAEKNKIRRKTSIKEEFAIQTWSQIGEFNQKLKNISFHQDGQLIAYTDKDGMAHLADLNDLEHTILDLPKNFWSLRFSPDGRFFAGITSELGAGALYVYDLKKLDEPQILNATNLADREDKVLYNVLISPNSELVVTARQKSILIWNLKSKTSFTCSGDDALSRSFHFSEDGQFLYSHARGVITTFSIKAHSCEVVDRISLNDIPEIQSKTQPIEIDAVHFSAGIATVRSEFRYAVVNFVKKEVLWSFSQSDYAYPELSPDGKLVIAINTRRDKKIYDLLSTQTRKSSLIHIGDGVFYFDKFMPDSRHILVRNLKSAQGQTRRETLMVDLKNPEAMVTVFDSPTYSDVMVDLKHAILHPTQETLEIWRRDTMDVDD